jgi:hypothetical protein
MKIQVKPGNHLNRCILHSESLCSDRLYVVEECSQDSAPNWLHKLVVRVGRTLWNPQEGCSYIVYEDFWRFSLAPPGTVITIIQDVI